MPISEKILGEISAANISDGEKRLMLSILEVEDAGEFRYQANYDKLITDYLEKEECGEA